MGAWLVTPNCHVFSVVTTAEESNTIRVANFWHQNVTCRVVHVREWRVLVRMMGFISTLVTTSPNHIYYRQYSAIADLHTYQFTAAHALGFSVFTSYLLATDINTETRTISLSHTPQILQKIKVFKSHPPFSSLYSQLLNPPWLSTLTLSLKLLKPVESSWVLCYNWRSVGQSVLV
jgi:hypothetical protein